MVTLSTGQLDTFKMGDRLAIRKLVFGSNLVVLKVNLEIWPFSASNKIGWVRLNGPNNCNIVDLLG